MERRVEKLFEAFVLGITVECGAETFRMFRKNQEICEPRRGHRSAVVTAHGGFYQQTCTNYDCGCVRWVYVSADLWFLQLVLDKMTEYQYVGMIADLALNKKTSARERSLQCH